MKESVIPVNIYPHIFPQLNVADIDVVRGAAGPGKRLVIWLQGCKKRCPGCANSLFLAEKSKQIISTNKLWERIIQYPDLDGITISGGEPLLQAAALIPLLHMVKESRLNTVCYSGYTLEELQQDPKNLILAEFLGLVDLLIDGEFRQEFPREGIYRPTSNQTVHFLGKILPNDIKDAVETEINILAGKATITGTLPKHIQQQFFNELKKEYGIIISKRKGSPIKEEP